MSQLECVPVLDDPSGCGSRQYSRVETWRDLTIMALADDEARLRARVIDLEAERDIYRDEAHEAIHLVARLTTKLKRLTAAYVQLLERSRGPRRDQ